MNRCSFFSLAFALTIALLNPSPHPSFGKTPPHDPAKLSSMKFLPLREGVVFFCPNNTDEAIKQLEQIQAHGFNLIEFASWAWTLPKPGTPFQQRVSAVLNWCDHHDMAFFLLQNIQYNDEGEGGGLDDQVQNPEKAIPLISDWANVLRGHSCVKGVILGNEVAPTLGDPQKSPIIWSQFRAWLRSKYGLIADLNAHWGSHYASFEDVSTPESGGAGWLDYHRYAELRFAEFYDAIVDKALKPVLGNLLYGNKTDLDPFLHRACRAMTMCCWDDLNSQYPMWRIKLAADTTGKPLFNAEMHLYEDNYNYGASIPHSRYRYFMSALLGEYATASFAWGQWNKPETRKVADATPQILSDLKKTQAACVLIARAYQNSDLMVLVTRRIYEGESDENSGGVLESLYAYMGALGEPWRYLLETDIRTARKGTLIIPEGQISRQDSQAIVNLPHSVRVYYLHAVPTEDEYGLPLSRDMIRSLQKRGRILAMDHLISAITPNSELPQDYRNIGDVSYLGWSPSRGFYGYPVSYCLAQVFRARTRNGWVIAVVNNSDHNIDAAVPWNVKDNVVDMLSGGTPRINRNRALQLPPFSVVLFQGMRK